MRIRLPVIIFSSIILVLAGICGWFAWRNAQILYKLTPRKDPLIAHTKLEYTDLADRIETGITDLNQSLNAFAARPDTLASNRFLEASQSFQTWIDSQQNNSSVIIRGTVKYSRDTADLMSHVKLSFDAYLVAARRVLAAPDPAGALQENKLVLSSHSYHLLDSATWLRSKAEQIGISHADWQKALLAVPALLAVLLFGGWLAFFIYHLKIHPLRRRLDEHAAIIEKQRKLAHFGELAAGLAHEIRNPLTAINARLFTLQRSLVPGTRTHEDTVVIRNEINRLDRVVGDFLKLARPAEPQFIPLTAEPLLRELVDLLGPGLQTKNIKLTLGPVVPAAFEGDPIQLKQILINLIKNAGESIGQDGSITLRTTTGTEPIKDKPSEVVILEVEDTGPGIPREVADRLFEPFFSTKTGGTGLGLSISWQIADKHGGMLTFENNRPTGSVFRLMLPRKTGD
jgi:signal transduction histidine kinase